MRTIAVTLITLIPILGHAQEAVPQVATATAPTRSWNMDIAGTVGIRPGIGGTTTGITLSVAATVVRTRETEPFHHRCLGVTVMLDGGPGERSLVAGPRWDAGGPDGTGFIRILAGVRRFSDTVREPLFAFGAGAGVEIVGVLLDLNWIVSPAAEGAPHRLSVSVGKIWSF